MEKCESGCPCDGFNCDLSLNVTDPVNGLESIGILDTSGNHYTNLSVDKSLLEIQGPPYNGECIDLNGLVEGSMHGFGRYIYVYDKAVEYPDPLNNTHIHDCADFCRMK